MRPMSVVQTWGSSAEERIASYPCDDLVEQPDGILFRAVDVAAPSSLVFRWLCQLRAAPYSYDWIDNFGRISPRPLTAGLEVLEVGQQFLTFFRLVHFELDTSITLDATLRVFGQVACTYRVDPVGDDRSRLVAKLAFAAPPGPYRLIVRHVLPAVDLVMMRRQLLTLKALAERDAVNGHVRGAVT
ncbi:MAG TPA: hypothetical protein VID75_13455 [Acidimicrobiales bacterium]|jgi:hypothetical protein